MSTSPWRPQREREHDRKADRELKREAVLRTAAQVFNEKGFQAATLDEVAERLHVSKPTLYYYVKNKDEILFECVRIGLTMLQQAVAEVDAAGGRAFDKLVAAMRNTFTSSRRTSACASSASAKTRCRRPAASRCAK